MSTATMQDNIQLPEKLIKAFPTRDLQLTPLKGDGGIIRLIFLVLVLIGLTVFVAFQLPGIAYDYKIGQNAVPVNANINGSCRASLMVITHCNVKVTYRGHTVSHSFGFLGTSRNVAVQPIADANDLSRLTVDVAVENVMLRFVTTIIIIALLIFSLVFIIYRYIANNKIRKVLLSSGKMPLKLIAVPAKVVNSNRLLMVSYKFNLDGKKISTGYSGNKKTSPIVFEENGKKYALAVCEPQKNIPYILDLSLKRIQATPEEVQHFHLALQEEGLI
ncbi:hypothetical protein AFL46_07180 [Providencia stuartii]|uniref:Transmembrane protein n=3 Tax=Morganellaceae TaxID=1903414 RepID=A0AA86YFG1_PROST|nr:hypothetical protein BGK56_12695 [Providencia stuartii]EDU57913.1 hypothetical protein PROSTU_04182 [Providencia stuartii ATCC 25827]KNZ86134.1 hypothetical protein AFL46_07180 [Providencia stuartii]